MSRPPAGGLLMLHRDIISIDKFFFDLYTYMWINTAN
jgi:hypothetical protein